MPLLVEYTSQSFGSEYPSPFGSSIDDATTGMAVAEAEDTVTPEFDPISHAEVNVIRKATKKR